MHKNEENKYKDRKRQAVVDEVHQEFIAMYESSANNENDDGWLNEEEFKHFYQACQEVKDT
jgi:hypothetical protein